MICHRSEKHSTGAVIHKKFKEISEGVMFLPSNISFTAFKQGDKRVTLRDGNDQSFMMYAYPMADEHEISPKGTVFTITQDSLT